MKPSEQRPKTVVKQQIVEILDSGDTPSMALSSENREDLSFDKAQKRKKLCQRIKEGGNFDGNSSTSTQGGGRHLNFQDTSTLIKSCNPPVTAH